MLRDFWFPILLALAGVASGIAANYTADSGRRVLWSIAIVLWAFAGLSYVWGDPVRGPFYKLFHPKSADTFWLHAGVAAGFPIKQLKTGIVFSRAISLPGDPIEFWVQRTWWAGWKFRVSVKGANQQPVVLFTNQSIERIPSGWDVNFDDSAVEVVDQNRLPRLQIIQAGNYDVYINTVLFGQQQAIVFKDTRLEFKPTAALNQNDFPDRLFKYPSYAHKGRRE